MRLQVEKMNYFSTGTFYKQGDEYRIRLMSDGRLKIRKNNEKEKIRVIKTDNGKAYITYNDEDLYPFNLYTKEQLEKSKIELEELD